MVRHTSVTLIPVHFPVVRPGQKPTQVIYDSLIHEDLTVRQGDMLAVASKIVSACERRIVDLADVRVTARSRRLSRRWRVDRRLASLVLMEADEIIGGVDGFLLTVKNGMLTPNAGVDLKNSPPGTATLWPKDPDGSAKRIRLNLERRFSGRIGVEIIDSHVTPLRLGTVGLAIGLSGFVPIQDRRGVRDLFGRPIRVTQANVADDLASAAHLLMGEASERIGAVLVRNSGFVTSGTADSQSLKLSQRKCLIGSNLIDPKT